MDDGEGVRGSASPTPTSVTVFFGVAFLAAWNVRPVTIAGLDFSSPLTAAVAACVWSFAFLGAMSEQRWYWDENAS